MGGGGGDGGGGGGEGGGECGGLVKEDVFHEENSRQSQCDNLERQGGRERKGREEGEWKAGQQSIGRAEKINTLLTNRLRGYVTVPGQQRG